MEKMIENQKEILEKLSKINLNVDERIVFENFKKILEINNENEAGIVSIWLEQKKEIFKDYISTKIIIDKDLPIYFQNSIFQKKINLALETLNSIDSAYFDTIKDWIDVYSIIFYNNIMNPNINERYKTIEKEFLIFFNKIYEKNLISSFIKYFNVIVKNILNAKINEMNTRFISFGFIRRTTDCIYNEDYSGLSTNIYFNKRMSNIFSNSKRLIRNLFANEFCKSLKLSEITNITFSKINVGNGIFEYNHNNLIIRFTPKESGINLGFKLDIIKKEQFESENILKSFYVKKYHGSTKGSSKNFEEKDKETFYYSASISFKASLSSISKKSEWKKRKFDLKEPFLYCLLNFLNFVPEVKFFINPYVIDGFYIITENISDKKNSFISLSKILIGINNYNDNFLKESLNQIDFISRILRLRDLHNENFGFIIENNQQIYKSLAIIDFAQPIYMESYQFLSEKFKTEFLDCIYSEQKNEGIRILILDDNFLDENAKFMKNSFLKVEEKIRFLNGFNALKQFNNRIENVKLPQINFSEIKRQYFEDEEPDDSLDEKLRNILYIQSQNIINLMLQKRGTENKPEENMLKHPITKKPRTNAELIGFKLGKKKDLDNLSEGQLDYIEDAFEDLDNYCKSIIYNYKILKKFIVNGYNKYFSK